MKLSRTINFLTTSSKQFGLVIISYKSFQWKKNWAAVKQDLIHMEQLSSNKLPSN